MFPRVQFVFAIALLSGYSFGKPQCPYTHQNIQTSAYYPRFRLPIPGAAQEVQSQHSFNFASNAVQPSYQVMQPNREMIQSSPMVLPTYAQTTFVESKPALQSYPDSGYGLNRYPIIQNYAPAPTPIITSFSAPVMSVAPAPIMSPVPAPIVSVKPAPMVSATSAQFMTAASAPIVRPLPAPIIGPAVAPASIPVTTTCGQVMSAQSSINTIQQQAPSQIPNQPIQPVTPCTQSRLIQPNCECPSTPCTSSCATQYGK